MVDALVLLVVVLVVVLPLLRQHRESSLAKRLEQTRDPLEASLMVDAAIWTNKAEAETSRTLRERVWPFLFRS